ncbi:MAG: hypothetical protein ACK445_12430 [Bacteroidota bacterium]|jgi:hypothetical protein
MKNIRQYENLHIILWLLKDACWLMKFKEGAVLMVLPTILVALYLAWKTRNNKKHFLPNIAVCLWICANATWMLGEFFLFRFETPALLFFTAGVLVIISFFFYRLYRKAKRQLNHNYKRL